MVLTHRVTDDTRTLTMRLVGTVIELYHRIENSSLNGLEAVPYIGKRTCRDYAHRIIDVEGLHFFFEIYFLYFVKNSIFHYFLFMIYSGFPFQVIGCLSDIKILYEPCILFYEFSSGFNLVTHQGSECKIYLTCHLFVEADS